MRTLQISSRDVLVFGGLLAQMTVGAFVQVFGNGLKNRGLFLACAPDDTEDLWLNYIENPGAPLGDEWLRMTPYTAGWLARHARDYIGKERERMHEEIARDLEINYPSRNVRNFRVIVVKDSRWVKREPLRRAQITIWDVLNITHTEGGKAGHFEEGQRFLATNLQPTQQAAWMAPGVDSVIYMSSRRDSRWTKLKN